MNVLRMKSTSFVNPDFELIRLSLSADDSYRFSLVISVKYSNKIQTISLVQQRFIMFLEGKNQK